MHHQGLRWNVHCVANVGLKWLNLYKRGFKILLNKRGFKIYDLLVYFFFRVKRPRPPLGRTKDSCESRDLRCLIAKRF